jgi:hypothetical protein
MAITTAIKRPVAKLFRRQQPRDDWRGREHLEWLEQGHSFAASWTGSSRGGSPPPNNSLRAFFDARQEGRGIWKWDHYFDLYDRHLQRFRGLGVHVLEIGVYSGGSLELWRDYFGPESRLYGVDVEEACMRYEDDSTRIFIGDQADRGFWSRFRVDVPELDVVIDDGGHQPIQQVVSLEELFPHLRPGGVYICEDIHGAHNRFASYVAGLVQGLNDESAMKADLATPERRLVSPATGFQSQVDSIHWYPYAVVIEKRARQLSELVAPKRGTEWEPFLE